MVAKLEKNLVQRVLDQCWDNLDPDAARGILKIRFSKPDIARINKLSELARAGSLTEAQEAELSTYNDFGRVIAIMQSKARMALKRRRGSSR